MPTYPIDASDKNCENVFMFLREKSRTKDGKTHRYWSVVENRRVGGGCVVQRQVLYLGELNDNQRAGWVRTIEAFSDEKSKTKQLAQKDKPYRCLDLLLKHRDELFQYLKWQWGILLASFMFLIS